MLARRFGFFPMWVDRAGICRAGVDTSLSPAWRPLRNSCQSKEAPHCVHAEHQGTRLYFSWRSLVFLLFSAHYYHWFLGDHCPDRLSCFFVNWCTRIVRVVLFLILILMSPGRHNMQYLVIRSAHNVVRNQIGCDSPLSFQDFDVLTLGWLDHAAKNYAEELGLCYSTGTRANDSAT